MIRKYNESTKKWEVIGSGNANSIELGNTELSEDGAPITVEKGFEKVLDKIENIEKNVSWIYSNGTLGGGGGGTGSGGTGGTTSGDSVVVTNESVTVTGTKNFLYISGSSVNVNFYVKTSGNSSKYTVTATLGGSVISGWDSTPVYSSKNGSTSKDISITSIDGNQTLVITATDSNGIELDSYILYIRVGSYTFSLENYSNVMTVYYNNIDNQLFKYYVGNLVPGSTATLKVICNGASAAEESVDYSTSTSWNKSYYLGNLLKAAGVTPMEGSEYKVSAYVEVRSATLATPIISDPITVTTYIASSNTLTLVVSGNSLYSDTTSEEDIKQNTTLGETLSVSVKIVDRNYSSFRLAYCIEDGYDPNAEVQPPHNTYYLGTFNDDEFDSAENDTLTTGTEKVKSINLDSLSPTPNTGLFKITVKAWSSGNNTYSATKSVIGRFIESTESWFPDYNPNSGTVGFGSMICQYNAFVSSKNALDTAWVSRQTDDRKALFPPSDNDPYEYLNLRNMTIVDTNGQTSGFLSSDLTGNAPALRLSGKAYSYIEHAPLSTYVTEGSVSTSRLQDGGSFTISITFKSDIHPDSNGTILSIGDYSDTKELSSGFIITLDKASLYYRYNDQISSISTSITQGELTTIDLVYEADTSGSSKTGSVKIYNNGVASAATFFDDRSKASIVSNSYVWFGCRGLTGTGTSEGELDNFCDVNIYDFKIYQAALNEYGITRNYINSVGRVKLNENKGYDYTLIKTLRDNNFFKVVEDSSGNKSLICELCDSENNIDTTWSGLYETLKKKADNPIPILEIRVTSENFYAAYQKIYSTNETATEQFDATMTYTDTQGKSVDIIKGTGEKSTSPYIELQGTTTLGYSAKNLEIYFGTNDGTNERLFTPKAESWLPENRFTLKADVVDSSHCNNAALGKFINESGVMPALPSQVHPDNQYRKKVKCTLEGFPIYLFVLYSPNDEDAKRALGNNINVPQFLGIYSFNLGRGSFFNMGFKIFEEYILADEATNGKLDFPSLVKSYSVLSEDKSWNGGCFSYEFNQNENKYGSFQSDVPEIINMVMDKKYPLETTSTDEIGFASLQFLFTILANCYGFTDGDNVKWKVTSKDSGSVQAVLDVGNCYTEETDYYKTDYFIGTEAKIDWNTANSYFLVAMAFGMVDSLGKNMVMRSWDSNDSDKKKGIWYTCFYDMDTGLGLNNFGKEIVGKNIVLHKYENTTESSNKGVYTTLKVTYNYDYGNAGYSTYNSRLWNVITRGLLSKSSRIEDGSLGVKSFRAKWVDWRTNPSIFASYTNFIDNYYKNQIADVGELMFNLDYKVKYFDPYTTYTSIGTRKDKESIGFLHGRRTEYVTDWMKGRLQFLDAVFLYDYPLKSNVSIPNSEYLANRMVRASGQNDQSVMNLGITSNIPNIFEYTLNSSTARAILEEDKVTSILVPMASGDTGVTFNLVNSISKLENFAEAKWSSLANLELTNLSELDLSDMDSLTNDASIGTSSGSPFQVMKELRSLNLRGTNLVSCSTGISLVCSNCTKLREIDISDSDVSGISLPNGGCLESLNISGSRMNSLILSSQPFLKELEFKNCSYLTNISLSNCPNIKELDLSGTSITTISINGCSGLTTIKASKCSKLKTITVDTCDKLVSIDLSESCTASSNPSEVDLNFLGAKAITTIILTGTNASLLKLNGSVKGTVKTIDISRSRIYQIQFDTEPIKLVNSYAITDFSEFSLIKSSDDVKLNENAAIKYLRFRNDKTKGSYFDIKSSSFVSSCTSLTRVFGHLRVSCSGAFAGTSSKTPFHINDPEDYVRAVGNSKISLLPGTEGYSKNTNEDEMSLFANIWIEDENSADGYSTNLTFASSDLSRAFFQTSVSIYDVYYVLSRCNKDKVSNNSYSKTLVDVTSLYECFRECSSITTGMSETTPPLSRNTFINCSKVTNIGLLFFGCGNMKGPLWSPTAAFLAEGESTEGHYDGLLSPLLSVTTISNAFRGCGFDYADSYFFYKRSDTDTGLKVKSITCSIANAMSVKQAGVENVAEPLKSSVFLYYLPNLTKTTDMLGNNTKASFNFETVIDKESGNRVTLFLHNNSCVTDISDTFGRNDRTLNQKVKITGWITAGIFGGNTKVKGTVKFDKDGKEITYSNFPKGITNFSYFLCPYNEESDIKVDWNGFNSLFYNHKNRATITSLEYMWGIPGSCEVKKGRTLSAEGEEGAYTEKFPNEVFSGLSACTSVAGFFYNHGITVPENENTVVSLPGDMFNSCSALVDIRYLFGNSSLPSNFYIKYTDLGFRNCKLKNVSHAFDRAGRILFSESTAQNHSSIPYHFFYMDYDVPLTTYTLDEETGTVTTGTVSRKKIRNTIEAADYVFRGNIYLGATASQYHLDYNGGLLDKDGKCGDLIWYNPNYDPRELILKDSSVSYDPEYNPLIPNPDYNPNEYCWDEWASDGIYKMVFSPTDISQAGAKYIDKNNEVNYYYVNEKVKVSEYVATYSTYDSDWVTADEKYNPFYLLDQDYDKPKGNKLGKGYISVFDFGLTGIKLSEITLWNDGESSFLGDTVYGYGKIESDDDTFTDSINESCIDEENKLFTVIEWTVDEEEGSSTFGHGKYTHSFGDTNQTYRYIIVKNDINEFQASEIEMIAGVKVSNLVNEVVEKYGPMPSSMNTAEDKTFLRPVGGFKNLLIDPSGDIDTSTGTGDGEEEQEPIEVTGIAKYGTIFDNFAFPSDLFRYCTSSCSVTYALAELGGNKNLSSTTETSCKLRGRLQPQLLSTLKSTQSLAGLFKSDYYLITPYVPFYLETTKTGVDKENYGLMFPEDLFKYNTASVTSVAYIFANIHVPYCVRLPRGLFNTMTGLSDISYAFSRSKWGGGNTDTFDQLNSPFSLCVSLTTAQSTWCMRDISTGDTDNLLIKDGTRASLSYVSKVLFLNATNPLMRDVSYMMFGNSSLSKNTELPPLWSIPSITVKTECFSGCNGAYNYSTAKSKGFAK